VAGLNSLSRIGLFGGTFDPPHLGHVILAQEAHYQLALDRVFWILTPDPPHKNTPTTQIADRIAMVEAVTEAWQGFQLSRVDLDRPGPYYALDTVRILRQQNPNADLVYLMGGDSLFDLPGWHRPKDFLQACTALGVMRRPDDLVNLEALEQKLPGISERVEFVDAPLLEISSQQVRARAAAGAPFRHYLPQPVFQLIEQRKLYSQS
jgi:nicotinate-nucleotide adenylyltransferase